MYRRRDLERVGFGFQDESRPVERSGNRRERLGDDRYVVEHRLDQRNAEAFMLAEADENVGAAVSCRDAGFIDISRERHVRIDSSLGEQGLQLAVVAVTAIEFS